jgi:hypothetical protein
MEILSFIYFLLFVCIKHIYFHGRRNQRRGKDTVVGACTAPKFAPGRLFTWGRLLRRQAAPHRLRENSKQVSEQKRAVIVAFFV